MQISNYFHLNSTLWELDPTSKVVFIKEINQQIELALPLLAKIKNYTLSLIDYRLEIGHFEALKAAFSIDPSLLKSVQLSNCGITD